jgi:hypothetical protein
MLLSTAWLLKETIPLHHMKYLHNILCDTHGCKLSRWNDARKPQTTRIPLYDSYL